MSIRITQNMLNGNMLRNLNQSYRAMDKYQDQLSSGKKINRPSDDPVIAFRGMMYRSNLMQVDQFKRNAEDGLSWMDVTDEAMDQVTNAIHRVRELTVQASNGTYEQNSKDAIISEIKQLKNHIGELANSTNGDKFIFAGTDTKSKPYALNPDTGNLEFMNDNTDSISWEVGQGSYVKINVNGTGLFPGVLQALDNVIDDLATGKNPGDRLNDLDSQLDNLLKERAILGANINRMEMTISRLDQLEVSTKKLMSQSEDADIAKVITELKAQENVHRAALSAGARIIQPTLVDFLR
jgi:flagellar hook-associated protein 3 FlgL